MASGFYLQRPRIAFINKYDRVGADFFNAIETMKDRLTPTLWRSGPDGRRGQLGALSTSSP
ncbi:MAG: hypothetical protein ACLU0O_03035 [Collinsella sp.]